MSKSDARKTTYGLGVTMNMGNYESVRVYIEDEEMYTGEPGDDRDAARSRLTRSVQERVVIEAQEAVRLFRATRDDVLS